MGFFMGYALSLYAREYDTLSHVLVSEPYETCRDFYYPTPTDRFITTNKGLEINAKDAKIMLAHIPIVRLRVHLPKTFISGEHSYRETIVHAQRNLDQDNVLIIEPNKKQIICNGTPIHLPTVQLALYMTVADAQEDNRSFQPNDKFNVGMEDYLSNYEKLTDHIKTEDQRNIFINGNTGFVKSFLSYSSKASDRIKKVLPFHHQHFTITKGENGYHFPDNLTIIRH